MFKTNIVAFLSRKLNADTQDHTSWNHNPDTGSQVAPAPAHKGTIGEIPVATEQSIQRFSLAENYATIDGLFCNNLRSFFLALI